MTAADTVHAISEELGVTFSNPADMEAVSRDAESFLMSILEISNRLRKHKGQFSFRALDINEALTSRRMAPLLGYTPSNSPEPILIGHCLGRDLLAFKDRQIRLSEFRGAPLNPYPTEAVFDFHWLALNGIQPEIEQNLTEKPSSFVPDSKLRGLPGQLTFDDQIVTTVSSKLLIPQQLQAYFFSAQETIRKQGSSTSEVREYKDLLEQLSSDAAFQPLVPFFVRTARDLIATQHRNQVQLFIGLNICRALFQNPNLKCESHLFSFISVCLTLMISPLGDDAFDELCTLREAAADFLGLLVRNQQAKYPDLLQRLADHLLAIILDIRADPWSQYGAAVGLLTLGPDLVEEILIPNLLALLPKLKKDLGAVKPAQRVATSHLFGVLKRICGLCFHRQSTEDMTEQKAQIYGMVREFFGTDLACLASPP
jgi:transcription initiation factor TFIID subunit 6